jgi:acyl-CoA thioester hydrolase
MAVRDYECACRALFNTSVYQTIWNMRGTSTLRLGVDFRSYTEKGINLVVIRVELDYRYPLKSGDKFLVPGT